MEVKVNRNPLREKFVFPHIGQRIIKTSVSVFFCILFYNMFKGTGWTWSAGDACVAAIICIQPYKGDSFHESLNRFLGVLLGDICGLCMLLLLWNVPFIGQHRIISYAIMSLGIGVTLYLCVAFRLNSAAALCAIIYISIIATYPKVHTPFATAWNSLTGTTVGIIIAALVNSFRLPGEKHPEYIFFVRLQDLVPDRYAHVASNVHVILNRLFEDGCKICLTTRWAPAFLMSQMGSMKVNVPAIVMDGAAVYDIENNKYLTVVDIPYEDARFLTNLLQSMQLCCAITTVRANSLLIYRHGAISWAEEQEYKIMKRSPYRNYVEGDFVKEDKIAVIRFMARKEDMDELEDTIRSKVKNRLRIDRRNVPGVPGYEGLFFTHPDATIENRKAEIVDHAIKNYRMGITPVDVISPYREFRSEREALHLLTHVKNQFEPSYIRKKLMK